MLTAADSIGLDVMLAAMFSVLDSLKVREPIVDTVLILVVEIVLAPDQHFSSMEPPDDTRS